MELAFYILFWIVMMCFFVDSKFSRKVFFAAVISVNVSLFVISSVLINFAGYDLSWPYMIVMQIGANILLSMAVSLRRDMRAIFSVLLAASFTTALSSLSGVLDYMFHNYFVTMSVTIICYGIVAYFSFSWLRNTISSLMTYISNKWGMLCIIPLVFTILQFMLAVYPHGVSVDPDVIPAILLLIPVQVFIYYLIFKTYLRLVMTSEEKQNTQAVNAQVALVRSQYDLIMEAQEKVRIYRHDMRHYMQLISSCLAAGKIDEAQKIISDVSSDIDTSTEIKKYCSDMFLNAVISHYAERCRKNDIDMKTDIRIGDELPVDDMSFSVVISNALENAFNACAEAGNDSTPFISLLCRQDKTQFFTEIKNTCSGTVVFDRNGKLPVSMDEEHGIGTRSISYFAESNNAILDYDVEDGVFTVHLLLYI